MKFAASIDSSFHEQFFWSMRCFLRAFYPQLELLSKLESVLSNPATALSARFVSYSKSSVVISAVFTASSPGVDSILNHLLCSSIKSNSQLLKLYHSLHSLVLSSGSTSAFLAVLQLLPPLKSGTPPSHHSSKTVIDVAILTSSHDSCTFLVAFRIVNP